MNNKQNTMKMLKFGEFMIDELGLYYDNSGIICDQEDDVPLTINGKNLVFPMPENGYIDRRSQMAFDPLNNPSLSKYLFGFFVDHRIDTNIDGFQTMPDTKDKDKGIIRVESDQQVIVETNSYYNDSVKYADAIAQLNGASKPDLTQFDSPLEKKRKAK